MSKRKVLIIGIIVVALIVIAIFLSDGILNAWKVPKKESRINVLIDNTDQKINQSGVAAEIELLLTKHVNWKNLFVSDSFKDKYKSCADIIDDEININEVWCGIDNGLGKDDTAIVYAYHKRKLFDTDRENDTADRYYFKYRINSNGEIDDLTRLSKDKIAVTTGEPIEYE